MLRERLIEGSGALLRRACDESGEHQREAFTREAVKQRDGKVEDVREALCCDERRELLRVQPGAAREKGDVVVGQINGRDAHGQKR